MESYKNICGDSGVELFEIGTDWIKVQFSSAGRIYSYSYNKAGEQHVEKMKKLARKGQGLATYITRHVKKLYD